MRKVLKYIADHQEQFREKWFEALRIPSVSALVENKVDIRQMANWLADYLQQELRLETTVIPTGGSPLVFARSPKVPGAPTLLVYGHYDVQPVDPLEQWNSSPFEPEIRDGNVYARGTSDDKGQLLAHVFGAKAFLEGKGEFPVQLKFIFEGEEEIGSNSLSKFLLKEENRKLLAADVIVVSDSCMAGPDHPAITYGLRGVVGFELTLNGANRDLHSGIYGGSVANPAIVLSKMLAAIVDENGRIQVPGFYDDVLDLDDRERKVIASVPFDEAESLAQIGLPPSAGVGETGYTGLERRCARPSFDINGLTSGYQGRGGKTIIPASASAKFTFRMVPNQSPDKLRKSLRKFLKNMLPDGMTLKLTCSQGSTGMVVPLDSPYMKAASTVLKKTFGNAPSFIRDGGSIPIVTEMRNQLNADVLLIGFGLDDDAIHSPNEKYSLKTFYQGIEASTLLLASLGKLNQNKRKN